MNPELKKYPVLSSILLKVILNMERILCLFKQGMVKLMTVNPLSEIL